jgi:hypothetical protein
VPAIKKTDNNIRYGGGAIISSDVKSHANDPFVIKKTEAAKIAVSKLVLPGTKNK